MKYFIFFLALFINFSCFKPKSTNHVLSNLVLQQRESDCYPIPIEDFFNQSDVYELLNSSTSDSLQIDEKMSLYNNVLGQTDLVLLKSISPPVSYYFRNKQDTLTQILCYDQGSEFINDSIADVNGDNLLDVLVSYREGGNQSTQIYLQNRTGFEQPIAVFNPKFLSEQIVTGFVTNNSPIVQYYTIQINQNRFDTLELIYFNEANDSIWSSNGKIYNRIPDNYQQLIPQ